MKYKFELSEEEVNLILEGVGKLPAEKVFMFMSKFLQEAQNQAQANEVNNGS